VVDDALFSSNTDEWETPDILFDGMNDKFNFTLDPCATPENAKCKRFFTEEDDGLMQTWLGEQVFVNPPFSNIKEWMYKCYMESRLDNKDKVMLIPVRSDTQYFSEYGAYSAELYFIKGRLKFSNAKNTAPFPSVIVVFNSQHEKERKVYWTDREFMNFW
jgi:site-specific DNA-methyltransferase (adenine-specific)